MVKYLTSGAVVFVFCEAWPFVLMFPYKSCSFALPAVSVTVGTDMKTGGSDWGSRGRAAGSYITLKFLGILNKQLKALKIASDQFQTLSDWSNNFS